MSWIQDKIGGAIGNGWGWVLRLDRQEWLMLLLVVSIFGFLCMRGYGSRNNY